LCTIPTKLIYIAIDGVAPVAKIKQQRMRRFKSVKTNTLFNNIKRKYKKPQNLFWNNSAITPGTKFMSKLTNKIILFLKKLNLDNVKILFSTAYEAGEGEHKILQYIKNNKNNYKYAIYGLDADLIFLSLSIHSNQIFLLREENQISKETSEKLQYVSIDVLKNCIINKMGILIDEEIELDKIKIINDFIFICYFLGNDFLPHIPSIDIKCYNKKSINGLDLLLQAYCSVFKELKEYIIQNEETVKYNTIFLQKFFEYLSSFENNFFRNLYSSKKRYYKCRSADKYDQEMHRIDNLYFKIQDDIELGKDTPENWKFRYYKKNYFCETNQYDFVQIACNNYFEGLLWVANYYFKECCSWNWFYKFDHAPFISDMAVYFKKFNMKNVKFELGKSLNPTTQLLSVLPPQSKYLLPKNVRHLMISFKSPIIYLYPIDYELDMLYKRKYWECIPILPALEIETIKKIVNDNGYKIKNEFKGLYIF